MRNFPLSLYIHLPWCVRKCPYCDFNSHPAVGGMDEHRYTDALIRDLQHDCARWETYLQHREVISVFFGGGTPSLFSAESVERILRAARQRLPLAGDAEITLEANPGASEQTRFAAYREAGVNRLSIGIQSFDDDKLRSLGRIHGRDEAMHAAQAARAAGFDNFNLDLMYALPEQTLAEAANDLTQAIDLQPAHISYYQLTLEPDTHFHRHPPPLPDHDLAWDMQLQGEELLEKAGYGQYEISAYAQPDRRCRHNLNYWQFGDYLGIGAGAHAKLSHPATQKIRRTAKQRLPIKYMHQAGTADALSEHEVPTADRGFEYLLNALRLKRGVSLEQAVQHSFLSAEAFTAMLQPAIEQGLLSLDDGRLCTTDTGWRHVDSILASLQEPAAQSA